MTSLEQVARKVGSYPTAPFPWPHPAVPELQKSPKSPSKTDSNSCFENYLGKSEKHFRAELKIYLICGFTVMVIFTVHEGEFYEVLSDKFLHNFRFG